MNYGTFQLGPRNFAVPLPAVREVLHRPRLSPVPLAPEELAGMALCRGEVLPVFEIHQALSAPPPAAARPRVLVLQHAGTFAGIAADTASTLTGAAPPAAPQTGLLEGEVSGFQILGLAPLFHLFESWLTSAGRGLKTPRRPAPSLHHA